MFSYCIGINITSVILSFSLPKKIVSDTNKTEIKEVIPVSLKETNKYHPYIEVDKLEVNNLPEGVQVATMCSSCKIGTKLQLQNIEKFMMLNENDVLAVKKNYESYRRSY